jgi:hypothetical protein
MVKRLPFKAITTMVVDTEADFVKKNADSPEEWADFKRICALRLKVMEGKALSPPPP